MAARLPISQSLGTGTAPVPYVVPANRHFSGAVHMYDPTDVSSMTVTVDGVIIGTSGPGTSAPTRIAPLVIRAGQSLSIAGPNNCSAFVMGFEMDNPT